MSTFDKISPENLFKTIFDNGMIKKNIENLYIKSPDAIKIRINNFTNYIKTNFSDKKLILHKTFKDNFTNKLFDFVLSNIISNKLLNSLDYDTFGMILTKELSLLYQNKNIKVIFDNKIDKNARITLFLDHMNNHTMNPDMNLNFSNGFFKYDGNVYITMVINTNYIKDLINGYIKELSVFTSDKDNIDHIYQIAISKLNQEKQKYYNKFYDTIENDFIMATFIGFYSEYYRLYHERFLLGFFNTYTKVIEGETMGENLVELANLHKKYGIFIHTDILYLFDKILQNNTIDPTLLYKYLYEDNIPYYLSQVFINFKNIFSNINEGIIDQYIPKLQYLSEIGKDIAKNKEDVNFLTSFYYTDALKYMRLSVIVLYLQLTKDNFKYKKFYDLYFSIINDIKMNFYTQIMGTFYYKDIIFILDKFKSYIIFFNSLLKSEKTTDVFKNIKVIFDSLRNSKNNTTTLMESFGINTSSNYDKFSKDFIAFSKNPATRIVLGRMDIDSKYIEHTKEISHNIDKILNIREEYVKIFNKFISKSKKKWFYKKLRSFKTYGDKNTVFLYLTKFINDMKKRKKDIYDNYFTYPFFEMSLNDNFFSNNEIKQELLKNRKLNSILFHDFFIEFYKYCEKYDLIIEDTNIGCEFGNTIKDGTFKFIFYIKIK